MRCCDIIIEDNPTEQVAFAADFLNCQLIVADDLIAYRQRDVAEVLDKAIDYAFDNSESLTNGYLRYRQQMLVTKVHRAAQKPSSF